jgi:hypothetical protein
LVYKRLTFYYRISMEVIVCFRRISKNISPLMAIRPLNNVFDTHCTLCNVPPRNHYSFFSLIFWLSLSPFTLVYHSLCTCCLYGAVRMDLYAGKTITWAVWRGGPWSSRLFWALKLQRAQRVPWGAVRYEFITYHLGVGGGAVS